MIVKMIENVAPGEILGEDIIHENIFLVKKGTKLSKRMISLLKRRQIREIRILKNDSEQLPTQSHEINLKSPMISKYDQIKIKDTFFQSLSFVGYEHRYGKILNQDKEAQLLIQLFTNMHVKHHFMDVLYALKSWDHYTFKHSFDVFVLGTLLAKRQGIHSLPSVALGYLFHDIGKIEISQDILGKKGKLTFNEFEQIQKHTIKGEALLNKLGGNHIAHFARSHHERIDGSGYPDELSRNQLSKALRVLHIVDVYSALTLKRPYKDAVPAQDALQILIQDVNQYDKEILYDFIEALSIYPVDSTVLLSDHTTATINQVSKHTPILPIIKRLDQGVHLTLPLDFSLTISKLIDARSRSFHVRFRIFLNNLINGDKQKCSDLFTYLVDGLQLEDIYTKIFLPTYWEIVKLSKDQSLTNADHYMSRAILIDLLEQLEREMRELNNYQFKMVIVIDINAHDLALFKIMLGLLHIENILPVVINAPIYGDQLEKHIIENNIESICVIDFKDGLEEKYQALQSFKKKISYISPNSLEQIFKDITDITGGSIDFYERLFNCREKAHHL